MQKPYNNIIAGCQARLKTHKKTLQNLDNELLQKTTATLIQAKDTITEILTAHKDKNRAEGRRKRIIDAKKTAANAPDREQLTYAKDQPKSLVDVAATLDIDGSPALKLLLEYLAHEVLQEKLSRNEYFEFIEGLQEYLEENL